jgi:hypothetical protein
MGLNNYGKRAVQLTQEENFMKTFLTLMCCLALTSLVRAEQEEPHKKKKNAAVPAVQNQAVQQQQVVKGKHRVNTYTNTTGQLHTTGQVNTAAQLNTTGQVNTPGPKGLRRTHTIQANNANNLAVQSNTGTTFKARRFQLRNTPNPTIRSVTFSPTYRIRGAQNWNGQQYVVFRNYQPAWHDRIWWGSHYSSVSLFGGGYYYLNNGYWYPAWGYDSRYQYYPYDGPIYAYNDLPPDQVVANVQAALQAQNYYQGEVDGLLGPLTRAALARYQQEHGLYTTAAIDQPTLAALGMS